MQVTRPVNDVDAEFQQLLARIRARFPIRCVTIAVGGRSYAFTRVADPDRLLERPELWGGKSHADVEPYWAEAWESAQVLADELTRRDLHGARSLDLGCGLGLVGAVTASRGGEVVMADYSSSALLFARINSWPWRRHVRVRKLDWRCTELNETFDLITGSDIIYDRGQWPFLEKFWRRHLAEDGEVLLAEPGRSTGREFLSWIAARKWRLEQRLRDDRIRPPIRVLQLRRDAANRCPGGV